MPPLTFNRRDFLTYGGATIAGVTLGETGRRWLARADARAAATTTGLVTETWAASVCRECPAACGTRVRLMDGTPVKIDGNPDCPVSRGRLCAKGQAGLEAYFDPDRLVGPARRVGRRGENRWQPISWAEAIRLCASHLDSHAKAGAVLALAADERGPIDDAWSGFWKAAGGRTAWALTPTAARFAPTFAALTGATRTPVFDVEHASYVLSFGAPLVEDWLSPLWSQRSFGRFRRGAGRPRGRLVQVEGRRSLTARKSDEWLAVGADHQAFVAYGLASVLLRENRIDRQSLDELGGNAADFENEIIARYTPDNVALVTGVPVVTLLRLARDLTATPQPLVIVAADAPAEVVSAVFALNTLIGALDRPGGVFEAPSRPAEPRHEHSAAAALAAIAAKHEDAPALVALRDASPFRSFSAPHDPVADLDRCGFIVSFSPYLDEAAACADLLLPTHTPIESWHGVVPPDGDRMEKFACARPAVAPRLDTRDLVEVLHAIASTAGGDLANACPASSAAAVDAEISRLWTLRRGTPYANSFETSWMLQLERGGWWVPTASSREEFGTTVVNAGGWVDPYVATGQLRQAIATRGGLTFIPPASRAEDALPAVVRASLDDAARAAEPAKPSMLRLTAFTPVPVNLAGSPNQPVLFELLGQPDGAPWRVWGEIEPETAKRFGIANGATVRVSSATAWIEIVAMLVERTPPNTIAVAYVPSLASGGRWARRVEADVRRLWPPSALGGEPLDVRVTPV
jgi:anaerobic selenocysteine-containing dehydrogenase